MKKLPETEVSSETLNKWTEPMILVLGRRGLKRGDSRTELERCTWLKAQCGFDPEQFEVTFFRAMMGLDSFFVVKHFRFGLGLQMVAKILKHYL